jgi:hypothetical protein
MKSSRPSTRYPVWSFWGPSFIGWPNYCRTIANIEEIFIIIISLNTISLRYNEETKKLRKLIRKTLTRKGEQCACYVCHFLLNLTRCVSLSLWQYESCLLWGQDFYWIKNSILFFLLAHEYRKFVQNRIYIVTFGDDVMVYVISWRRSSRVQSLAQE